MKKILFILSIFITSVSFGQIPKYLNATFPPIPPQTDDMIVDCSIPVNPDGCNYMNNKHFEPSLLYDHDDWYQLVNPFNFQGNSLVPNWDIATGTPTIYDTYHGTSYAPLPPNGNGYFFGGTGYDHTYQKHLSESVVQKIPTLIAGKTYTLNFYKMFWANASYPVDNFKIVLMKCADYASTFIPISYEMPVHLPVDRQTIYCETSVANPDWEKVFIKFTAEQDFDMIWIYPERNHDNTYKTAGLFVSLPELIDIANFTAGSTPYATPPNCTVTLGPLTPNCYPTGAVFTWYDPLGNPYSTPANTQQIQVNTAIAANIGVWTLKMTLPNVVTTNNSCSQNISELSATVTVVACGTLPPVWPKVYTTIDGYSGLIKDNNGNIILASSGVWGNSNYYNHVGFPPVVNHSYKTFHFTSGGITNWMLEDEFPVFAFRTGIIETSSYLNPVDKFYDGTTGLIVTPPLTLLPFERVIAETNTGAFITILNNELYVHTASGTSPGYPIEIDEGAFIRFNPNTDNLTICGSSTAHARVFKIVHYNGTILQTSYERYPDFSFFDAIAHIDNQDKCYVYQNGAIKEYDYINPGPLLSVNIPGFNNTGLWESFTPYHYTDNHFFVYSQSNEKIYALDFTPPTPTCKKIQTQNFSGTGNFAYELDGDNFYLLGTTSGSNTGPIYIGSQQIPDPNIYDPVPIFLTRLSLQNDFSSFQAIVNNEEKISKNSASFTVAISPNPTTGNILSVRITELEKRASLSYSFIITNRMGRIVLQKTKYLSNTPIDIGNLEKGIYYIEIINIEGERVPKSFVKF